MAPTAHDGDTAPFILFWDIQPSTVYCTHMCPGCGDVQQHCIYIISWALKKSTNSKLWTPRTEKSDCMEYLRGNSPSAGRKNAMHSVIRHWQRLSHPLRPLQLMIYTYGHYNMDRYMRAEWARYLLSSCKGRWEAGRTPFLGQRTCTCVWSSLPH